MTTLLYLAFINCFAQVSEPETELSAQQTDSLERAFDNGEFFFTNFIRLEKGQPAFIYLTDEYMSAEVKDTATVGFFLRSGFLRPDNREAFYERVVSALPKEDIAIHKKVWAIPEIQQQGIGNNGGMYTLATWIVQKPSAESPFWFVEARRNYFDRLGICTVIGYIKIDAKSGKIFVDNLTDGYLPLRKWRRAQRKED